jgi:predicted site-specific integrase-resolvase
MSLHTAAEGLKEVAIMWENLGPGADHEREDVVEDLASMVLSMKATLAQRKVRMGSVQKASSHPL